ncbi:uncharacterized protein LOC120435699 [Oreochromis aureus]|uniref:ZP domain-containing protein n=1 Tax=Oreochromis aureus TaxID=47969 RepID=A0AAZ1XX15_OREAU|nr:uncharacterized protein LOC120435699 [Oreochromis aureus]XP_039461536.1 uncharacterized protein LOC120435699 [Oreochromis aureus]XP_039461540.1 uncharacterized protein LOC120435699 [Oreochromis aureus]
MLHPLLILTVLSSLTAGDSQSVNPCNTYTVLNDEWHPVNKTNTGNEHCDVYIHEQGWYRLFLGNSNARIPERCVEPHSCGTQLPLWITEPHPTQPDETVTVKVCLSWYGSCCILPPQSIQVKLCYGGYYVYKLAQSPECKVAYCAESYPDVETSTVPSEVPSVEPSVEPSEVPRVMPSVEPSVVPSVMPSVEPSVVPSVVPSVEPSEVPSVVPSVEPSVEPSVMQSAQPSKVPSVIPSVESSMLPSEVPSVVPSVQPSEVPSVVPSVEPSVVPSVEPSEVTCRFPSVVPSVEPSEVPSMMPSVEPSVVPSVVPSVEPSEVPSVVPSVEPSVVPSVEPSEVPSMMPSVEPSVVPSVVPSVEPSEVPSVVPSVEPSEVPSVEPSVVPSMVPSVEPSVVPSMMPSVEPSVVPSVEPSVMPNVQPSDVSSVEPSEVPSVMPSVEPSVVPSVVPSVEPSVVPSVVPSVEPSEVTCRFPSVVPGVEPSEVPSVEPSVVPSEVPSVELSVVPSVVPSVEPSEVPSVVPSVEPSVVPSVVPSVEPSVEPSVMPSVQPSVVSSVEPSEVPSVMPSVELSVVSSVEPSEVPSMIPSVEPSEVPSIIPSVVPSVEPSVVPSVEPSLVPSVEPSVVPSEVPSMMNSVCTVTGPTVIDFHGQMNSLQDRCGYCLFSTPSVPDFHVQGNFRERHRKDVSFLDSVTLCLGEPGIRIHLEQGGRVQLDDSMLTLNSLPQLDHGVQLSKDQTGVTAKLSLSNLTISVFFDGYTAQIHLEGPAGSSVEGLCGNSRSLRLPEYSSTSCEMQYSETIDNTINCTSVTERCNLLKKAPFSSCNSDIDPEPYITACTDILCKYPAVDGLNCQFLKAYARACSLHNHTLDGWTSKTGCSSEAFCQDWTCSDHEFCGEKTVGGDTRCFCRAIFASKYQANNSLGDPTVCMQDSASVTLVGCLLEDKDIDYSALHLNDPSCRGQVDELTHMVTFSFNSSNSCGTEVTTNNSQVIYKNTIMTQNSSSDIITRHDQVYIDFSCVQTQPDIKTETFRIRDSSVIQHITSGVWDYTLTMQSFTDAGRTQAVESNTDVQLNQKIWVELKTDGLDGDMVVMVTDSCWGTDQPSPDSTLRYNLIINSCANPADQTVQVEENGLGTSNYFSFNMFEFTGGSGEVFLHCKLHLCPKQNNCVPTCPGAARRRRSARSKYEGEAFISMAWTH